MSAKPSSLPIWATAAGAQVTEPNLATKQQGHLGGEPFFGDYENWYKHLVYLWTQYLSDGVFAGPTEFLDDVSYADNMAVAGAVQANGGVVVGPNQHVVVSGTGRYKRGDQRDIIPAAAGLLRGGTTVSTPDGDVLLTASDDEIILSFTVRPGLRIKGVEMRIDPGATGVVSMQLRKKDVNGQPTSLGSVNSSGAALQTVPLVVSELVTVEAKYTLYVRPTTNASQHTVLYFVIVTDVP